VVAWTNPRIIAGAAAATLVLALAGSLFWLDRQATLTEQARRDGLAAAVRDAGVILSYDHRRLDAASTRPPG